MKIFPLLVLSLNFLLVTKTNGLVLERSKRQTIDRKDDLETGLATIKLTTTTGISCGGFYVFAQICKENGIENDCCEDEIVKNGDDGFDAGDTIESKFENCAKFVLAPTIDNLTVKLTGWNELTKNSEESFCPKDLEIETIRGAKLKTSFANERVRKTPKTTLKFFDEGICPPEFKYVYDGGRKCCQYPYEDNDELNLLQFNSRQCQSNATLDCPFAEGCDDYDSICQDEYVGVEVDKFGSSLRKLNGRYEEAVLLYNRPVYIQFEKPFDAESQIRKDNCIWWHSTDRRWQIGNCNDIGARGQAYFDKDVKCLPNFQIRDSWREKSGDALLKGRTEMTSGFINPETRQDIKTCKARVFGTFRKNFGQNKFRLRYSCSWKYIENGEFNCNEFDYNILGSTISQANRGCRQ